MDNICKGDQITKRGWDPKSFVRVGWVHYYGEGKLALAGVDQNGNAYVNAGTWPNHYFPWVKVEFNFKNDDVLELVNLDGDVIRRSMVVDVMPGKDTFLSRDITDRGLSSQVIRSVKEPTGGNSWRKSTTMNVSVAYVPTKFVTEHRAPNKGERVLAKSGGILNVGWDYSTVCDVIIEEVGK